MAKRGRRLKENDSSNKTKRAILKLLQCFFITTMIVSAIFIYKWWKDNKNNSRLLESISEHVIKENDGKYKINFNELKTINNEIIGWIKVEGTGIDYPVLQHTDNEYYLKYSFDRTYNRAGWVFADYTNKLNNTDQNLVIYGHNRKDGSMFGTLKNVLKEEWYNNEKNKYINYITENSNNTYEVFSVYKIENEDYYIRTKFNNDKEFQAFIDTIKSRSIKNFNIEVTSKDNILTLSTCADNNNYRVVLHAKKINK